jgi:hypothetical protein
LKWNDGGSEKARREKMEVEEITDDDQVVVTGTGSRKSNRA